MTIRHSPVYTYAALYAALHTGKHHRQLNRGEVMFLFSFTVLEASKAPESPELKCSGGIIRRCTTTTSVGLPLSSAAQPASAANR